MTVEGLTFRQLLALTTLTKGFGGFPVVHPVALVRPNPSQCRLIYRRRFGRHPAAKRDQVTGVNYVTQGQLHQGLGV